MISEEQLRKQICKIGERLYQCGFVAANDGNISARLDDNKYLITPTGVSKADLTLDNLIVINDKGEVLAGNLKPSSEYKMHLAVYHNRPDIHAVVHAHPPISTAFAVCRKPLDMPILAEAIVNLGVIPLADYALTGTDEVPNSILPFVKDYNAALLANHGLITWGRDLQEAHFRMESAEHYAKIYLYAKEVGEPVFFNRKQIDELVELRTRYGVTTGGEYKLGDN